jgi:hypothetical protein
VREFEDAKLRAEMAGGRHAVRSQLSEDIRIGRCDVATLIAPRPTRTDKRSTRELKFVLRFQLGPDLPSTAHPARPSQSAMLLLPAAVLASINFRHLRTCQFRYSRHADEWC